MVEDLNKTTVSRNALVTEVAERTLIENELRKSQQRLSSFMESATDGFILYDSELNLVEINKAALAIFPPGIKKDSVIGKNIKKIPLIINNDGKSDRYQEVIKTKKPFFTDV
ncbi:MAG: PAS domain S-box protein, partial [bacterium]